jgi:hypothetical protein
VSVPKANADGLAVFQVRAIRCRHISIHDTLVESLSHKFGRQQPKSFRFYNNDLARRQARAVIAHDPVPRERLIEAIKKFAVPFLVLVLRCVHANKCIVLRAVDALLFPFIRENEGAVLNYFLKEVRRPRFLNLDLNVANSLAHECDSRFATAACLSAGICSHHIGEIARFYFRNWI